jgi:hypothetical protein
MSSQQTIVFLIGPDRCGKSNIAKELSKRTQIPYFKPSEEKLTFINNQSKFFMDIRYADPRMVDFLKQTEHSAIFDRGYPCEWVYSRFFNRETDLAAIKHVDNVHSSMGTKLVIAYRSNYDNVIDDLDPKLTGNKLFQLENLYRDFAEWSQCQSMFLNVDSEDLDDQVNKVIEFLQDGDK